MKISISTRLAIYYGLSLLLILCAFVVYLYTSFHVGLHQEFREQLERDESRLKKSIQITRGTPTFNPESLSSLSLVDDIGEGSAYVRLLSVDGDVLDMSRNLEERDLFKTRIPGHSQQTIVNTSWQGRPAQSLYSPLASKQGMPIGWLEITRVESGIHRELHRLGWLLGVGILLGAVLAIGFGHWMARRALSPIAAITKAARDIQVESSSKRLPERFGIRDELTDLAETLNNLLGRLDASLERERRFRADAAHQMFTPLAAIQSEIEISLRRTRSSSDYELALRQVERQSKGLSEIVEGLLKLSRAESLSGTGGKRIDLSALIRNRLADFEVLAEKQNITLRQDIANDLYLSIPPDHASIVIDNLVENALKYTSCEGTVSVSVHRKGDTISIEVEDTGMGLTAEEKRRIFDRFYRSEREEVTKIGGVGLGLSIVQATVQAYGGKVSVESAGKDQGSKFSVLFPVS